MVSANDILSINSLIGMTVLSRETGNRLGQIEDLIIEPVKGIFLGLTTKASDGMAGLLDYNAVYRFGQDAVMANDDASVKPVEEGFLATQSRAKKQLIGVDIITEGGKLMGQVANVFVHLNPPPLVIYEVRETILDKLLGRAVYIPASAGRALSDNAERIVVPDDVTTYSADSLEALANRLFSPSINDGTTVHSRDSADNEETRIRQPGT